jgi:F-type H+-transporting ATPase subunit b
MLIDWFTVGAQTINFILLVWLLKRFLYQPILNAIDAREKKITDELARADAVSQQANQAKASFERKVQEFELQRDQLLADATETAKAEHQRLLEAAHQSLKQLEMKRQKDLQDKMQTLQDSIRSLAQRELFAVAKNALRDLAAVDIESQIVAVFVKQLRDMDSDAKSELRAALTATPLYDATSKLATQPKSPATQIKVRSSNTLSADQQSTIAAVLAEFLGNDFQLQFEQSADMIGGIELATNSFKIGWNLAEYLQSLEDSLSEDIKGQLNTETVDEQTPQASSANANAAATVLAPKPEQNPVRNAE